MLAIVGCAARKVCRSYLVACKSTVCLTQCMGAMSNHCRIGSSLSTLFQTAVLHGQG